VGLAIQHFDEALKLDPSFHRALYYRGVAHETAGEYRAAIEDFQARLSRSPGQVETTAALARIYEEVGEIDKAKALYQKIRQQNPEDLRSAVTLAAIAYQLEGNANEAVSQLRALLKEGLSAPPAVRGEGWIHLAAAERLTGNLEGASAAAQEALKLPGGSAPGHLQLLLVELQRGRPDQAASHLAELDPKALTPALVKHLQGRILFAQGKDAEAAASFNEAYQLEPRRLDSLIYAGVATARGGKREEGYRLLTQAMQADPTRLGPRPAFTLHYLQPRDTLDGADGHLLKTRDPNDPTPFLAEGFIKFHRREFPEADRLLKQATETSNNAFAYAYRTLVALARGDKATALAEGARAVSNGRQLAIAHYAQGAALAADSQLAAAKKALRQARDLAPTLLAAELLLGELEAKANGAEAIETARSHLVRVTGLDPSYLPAKRALYALER
jgi:tetratricopeptide (TPR) repeat protein